MFSILKKLTETKPKECSVYDDLESLPHICRFCKHWRTSKEPIEEIPYMSFPCLKLSQNLSVLIDNKGYEFKGEVVGIESLSDYSCKYFELIEKNRVFTLPKPK